MVFSPVSISFDTTILKLCKNKKILSQISLFRSYTLWVMPAGFTSIFFLLAQISCYFLLCSGQIIVSSCPWMKSIGHVILFTNSSLFKYLFSYTNKNYSSTNQDCTGEVCFRTSLMLRNGDMFMTHFKESDCWLIMPAFKFALTSELL